MNRRRTVLVDRVADRCRQGVDQTALDPGGGHHAFAEPGDAVVQADGDVFQRRAGEFADHQFAPGLHLEAAITGLQRRQSYAALLQWQHPRAVRTQARPTAATEGEQGGIGLHGFFAFRAVDAQTAMLVPAEPAMAGVDNYTAVAQAFEPGAQQRCGFHVGGEYPAGTADEGLDAQLVNPLAQRFGAEAAQQRGYLRGAFGVAREKCRVGFGVSDVHAADAGQEEFSSHRRHAVVQVDLDPGLAQHFSCHQTGRTAADDGDAGRGGG
ncbi:hypothetical protein D9M71_415670 [compost metagenome]